MSARLLIWYWGTVSELPCGPFLHRPGLSWRRLLTKNNMTADVFLFCSQTYVCLVSARSDGPVQT